LSYLGRACLASGDLGKAVTLLDEAVRVADTTSDIEPAVEARSGLALTDDLHLGDPAAAWLWRPRRASSLIRSRNRGCGCCKEWPLASSSGSRRPCRPLAMRSARQRRSWLAELNIAALQAQVLVLSGLAAATDDPLRATQAIEALTQLRRGTRAAGAVADNLWLLDAISSAFDPADVFADVISTARDL
jgi:hypothetical protein